MDEILVFLWGAGVGGLVVALIHRKMILDDIRRRDKALKEFQKLRLERKEE